MKTKYTEAFIEQALAKLYARGERLQSGGGDHRAVEHGLSGTRHRPSVLCFPFSETTPFCCRCSVAPR